MQFTNALKRLAEKQTLIAFIEDIHWADISSLGLLFHLARNLQGCALLFVCTYRPVEAMETGTNVALFRDVRANLIRYNAVELEIQQGVDVSEYVSQRYPLNTFSSDLIKQVQELTGGHALFVSQLFSLWQDNGVITSTPTPDGQPVWGFVWDTDTHLAIPKTVEVVLEERIRLMEDDLREILTCASVEGEDFTAQIVACLHRLDEYKIYDSFEMLEHRYRLIQEQTTKTMGSAVFDFYRFAHSFFREYIYSQLSSGKRRILNRQVGECLETLYSDRHQIAGQLALHFREAHEMKKAAGYALMAAQFEQSRYAWAEGEKWCEFGLSLIDKLLPMTETAWLRLDLLEQSGYGYYNFGKYTQADKRYQAALILAQQLQVDAARMAHLYERLGIMCVWENQIDEVMKYLDEGRQVLADRVVPFGETHVELEILGGLIQMWSGHNDLAVQSLHRVLANAENLPQTLALERAKIQAYQWLAGSLSYLNHYSEAVTAYQKAIEIANSIDEKGLVVSILLDFADLSIDQGNLDRAEILAFEALEIAQQIGDLDGEAHTRSIKARILLARGKPQDVVNELNQAITLSEQIGSMWDMSFMRATLALAYLAIFDLRMAYQQAIQSLAEAEKNPNQFDLGYAHCALAQVEVVQQNWNSAEQHFNQAIAVHQQEGNRHWTARTQRYFAKALLQQGEQQKAIELLKTALATFQELSLIHEIAETQHLLDAASS